MAKRKDWALEYVRLAHPPVPARRDRGLPGLRPPCSIPTPAPT